MMEARVAALLRRTPGVIVFVKGDRAVPYGRVVEAMTLLQRAGASKVGFLTEPVAPTEGR
jgi:biopolymer transport protein TolR